MENQEIVMEKSWIFFVKSVGTLQNQCIVYILIQSGQVRAVAV